MHNSTQGHLQQASGQAYTPNQSFSDSTRIQHTLGSNSAGPSVGGGSAQMATSGPVKPTSSVWADRNFLEDYEHCRTRMSDTKFNIRTSSCLVPGTPILTYPDIFLH